MINDSTVEFIKNKFSEYQNCRKLISAKEVHKLLTCNEFEYLLNEARKESWSIGYLDKNDLIKQFIRFILLGNKELKRCKVCDKELSLNQTIENRTYCSVKCKNKDKDFWMEKTKNTNLARYGETSNLKTKEFIEKTRKTCLEKYGVEGIQKSEYVKNKIKETNNKRYGHECSLHGINEERTRSIVLNKYGNPYYILSDLGKQQLHETWSKKSYNLIVSNGLFLPLFSIEEAGKLQEYKWKCVKCRPYIRYT